MAGVRSPYFDPLPDPLPPAVRWSTCARPLKLFALNSKETFHSFFSRGMVVRSVFLEILCSPRRE